MKFQVSYISTCVLILLCASAGGQEASPAPMPEAPFSGMDRSVRPGSDFYDFANGAWQRSVEIPADLSGYSVWAQLAEQNRQRLTALFSEIASSSPPGDTAKRKVVDYYSSFMDE